MNAPLQIIGVGLVAPGLMSWKEGCALLSDPNADYCAAPLGPVIPSSLPANDRRRTTLTIRLALRAAEEALAGLPVGSAGPCSVFCSNHGDMEIVDKICRALAQPDHPVSPTQFHNSVHNAPAGYWSIAHGVRSPSTSIATGEGGFAGGLLEAAATAWVEQATVLLVAYDLPGPSPISSVAPVAAPLAVALLLSSESQPGGWGCLMPDLRVDGIPDAMVRPILEELRCGNPAGQALPLLRSLARRRAGPVLLPYLPPALVAVDYWP